MDVDEAYADHQLMRIARAIELRGFAAISVGYGGCSHPECSGHRSLYPWTYTIGLVEIDHPEVVLFGSTPTIAGHLLNELHDRIVGGAPIDTGVPDRLHSTHVRLDPVPPTWANDHEEDPMGQWFHHYGAGRPVLLAPEVLQLVWADRRGRFPDEPGCDQRTRRTQPLLSQWC